MKLILDFGNTLKKVALFKDDELLRLYTFENFDLEILEKICSEHPEIKSAIISSVINYPDEIDTFLKERFYFINLDHTTPIPVTNKYKTPNSLGKDRIAAVVAAASMYPESNVLVIDAGSCITFDFINAEKEYLGGAISPGINLRLKSLNSYTDKLPLLKAEKVDYLIGSNTPESILSGVINGIICEMNGIIGSYKENYEKLTIILGGGDYNYFDKRLKNNIFALPNIVLLGLNVILEFNESTKK